MSVAISEVNISGGPLPEGNLCAYSYDPTTSCVYLTRLVDDAAPVTVNTMSVHGISASVNFTGLLYPGVVQLQFTSSIYRQVGTLTITNLAGQTVFSTPLMADNKFDPTIMSPNTVGFKINDRDTYTVTIAIPASYTLPDTSVIINNAQLISLSLPTGVSSSTVYNNAFDQTPALTGIGVFSPFEITLASFNPINTSYGYIRKNGKHLALQTLAPFPPPFYDPEWVNTMDYAETTSYTRDYVSYKAQNFFTGEAFLTTPDLSKVVKLIDDIHARPTPNCYSIALITQETVDHQLMWRCIREQRIFYYTGSNNQTTAYNYYVNKWVSAEKVYKYKAGGIYFGGKDYSGPLNSIAVDAQDGVNFNEYKILDLNEFPVNANNELFVYAYVCNYNSSAPKIYCVLNKQSGRMAEIDPVSKQVKYFTLVVPNDSEVCQLYFANRLMYTVRNTVNNAFSLYDANNNGILLYAFDLGTYNPSVIPQFTVIN